MIKHNIKYLILIYIVKSIVNIFLFFLLARLLNIADYGIFSFGFAFAMLVTAFAEYGYGFLIIRDLNQNKYDKNIQINNMYLQKILLTIIVVLIAIVYLYMNFIETEYFEISLLFLLYAVINSFVMFNNAIFKAYQRFEYELSIAVSQFLILFISFIFLVSFDLFNIVFISISLIVSRLVSYFYSLVILDRLNIKLSFKSKFDIEYNKYLLLESSLFGLQAIFAAVYLQFDAQVIATYLSPMDIAFHQNIFKIIMIFGILSEIIGFAYLPKLSEMYVSDNKKYNMTISKVNNLILALTFIGFYIFYIFKEPIIELMYSDKYLDIVKYIGFVFIVVFIRVLNFIFGTHLSLSKFQKQRAIAILVTVFIGILTSLYIIPIYGLIGAMYNMILVHILLYCFYLYYTVTLTRQLIFNKLSLYIFSVGITVLYIIVT